MEIKQSEVEHKEVDIEVEYYKGKSKQVTSNFTRVVIDRLLYNTASKIKIEVDKEGNTLAVLTMFLDSDEDITERMKYSGCSKYEVVNEVNNFVVINVTWKNPVISIKAIVLNGDENEEKN